jgi:predicted kinase
MQKTKLILTVGISGSGKTTWAEEFTRNRGDWVNINRDDIRFAIFNSGVRDWSAYKFKKSNESLVSETAMSLAMSSSREGKSIIISDTNLSQRVRNMWRDFAKSYNMDFEEKQFDISWEEAAKRDSNRAGGVGVSVLRKQWEMWNTYIGRKVYVADERLPKAFLIDLDGTLCENKSGRGWYDWDRVDEDSPREHVISIVHGLIQSGLTPVFLSGRDGSCIIKTYDWIIKHVMVEYLSQGCGIDLLMREPKDQRRDSVVKEEIFWKYVASRFNIVACIDDRPQMIRAWEDLKIPNIIAVGNQTKEF